MTQISGLMFGLLALLIVGSPAAQTTYPEKPIRLVVPFPPGSQPDIVARLLGQKLAEAWGKPVVIDNAAGAAGTIATDRVAKAAPDGYTLGLLNNAQLVINPSLYKLAYDPAKDFALVSQVTVQSWMLVVHNAVPAKSVRSWLVWPKRSLAGSRSPPAAAVAPLTWLRSCSTRWRASTSGTSPTKAWCWRSRTCLAGASR